MLAIPAETQKNTMRIFVDTEFTNFKPIFLISIGMVADSGAEFYAETHFPKNECSDFVKQVVLPLLGRKRDRIFDNKRLGIELLRWLESVRPANEDLEICFDFYVDGLLLEAALAGPLPGWCRLRNVNSHIDDLLVKKYFEQTGNAKHHALNDARAIQFAYRGDASRCLKEDS